LLEVLRVMTYLLLSLVNLSTTMQVFTNVILLSGGLEILGLGLSRILSFTKLPTRYCTSSLRHWRMESA
jgi:hypothetical protein